MPPAGYPLAVRGMITFFATASSEGSTECPRLARGMITLFATAAAKKAQNAPGLPGG